MFARREDEPELLAYFNASPDETSWLRVAWHEKERIALVRDAGRVVGMALHNKAGVLQVHAPQGLAEVVNEAVVLDRKVAAVAGPPEQMKAAIDVLGFGRRPVARLSQEIVMGLDLDQMVMPDIFQQPGVVCRRATSADVPLLTEWRMRYFTEVHGALLNEHGKREVIASVAAGRVFVLEVDGQVVNTSELSAVLAPIAQLEYAYGPPELRAKKYGRSAAAGALAHVKSEGITRGVLNTDHQNVSVYNAVSPLGFRKTADYHVTLFGD